MHQNSCYGTEWRPHTMYTWHFTSLSTWSLWLCLHQVGPAMSRCVVQILAGSGAIPSDCLTSCTASPAQPQCNVTPAPPWP